MFDVVHVTTAHSALDGRIFYKEAIQSAKSGFTTCVVGPHSRREVIAGVTVVPIPRSRYRLWRRLSGPWVAFAEILRTKCKIVHFHDPEFIPAAFVLLCLRKKVVYDIHEFYSEIQAQRVPSGPLRWVVKALAKLCLEQIPSRCFHRIVFPTYALRDVVYNGSRSEVLVNLVSREKIQLRESRENKEFDVVFMGSLSPFRAGPMMEMIGSIQAEIPHFRMLFLGIRETTVDWMRVNAPSEMVAQAMEFQPKLPHDQVVEALAGARIGFNYHPMEFRFRVAIPMKVYEYMIAGLAVVTSRFPELEKQFEDGHEIAFVDGEDMQAYGREVVRILKDKELLATLASAGFAKVLNSVNWESTEAEKIERMYGSLLE